jgi:hypothetical protein
MTFATYVVLAFAVAALAYLLLRRPLGEYLAMRGDRLVTCPDNGQPAAVRVDAAQAAISAARGFRDFNLESCSRWPEKAGCGQACLRQIEAAPMDCLVRTKLERWYADKTCALCGKPLGNIDWTRHRPAVLSPDRETYEWHEIKPESIPSVMHTHWAICWDCHVVEVFRRQRADLVLDNPFAEPPRR